MAVREYVGARYVPIFANPAEWSDTVEYEPLTVVLHDGNSYTSRQFVPVGTPISNESYWAETGNYNAQVEKYRQEVKSLSTQVSNMGVVLDKEKNKLLSVFSVLNFEGVSNDGSNVSSALQSAIDSIPEGSYVVFPYGKYMFDSLELKDGNVYDFQNSTIINSGITAISAKGTLKAQKIPTDGYTVGKKSISLNNSSSVLKGDLLTYVNDNELFNNNRSYYYKGGTTAVTSITENVASISFAFPYSIGSIGAVASIYTPKTVTVMNIGDYICNSPSNATYLLKMENCKDCVIDGVSFKNADGSVIGLVECYSTSISHVNGTVSEKLGDSYGVMVGSSTYTFIENCNITSGWHCITTGHQETNYYTTVKNCVLDSTRDVHSYWDHENSIYTTLEDCKLTMFGVANSATMVRCKIDEFNSGTNQSSGFVASLYEELSYFRVDDCEFNYSDGENHILMINTSPAAGANPGPFGISSIRMNGCTCTGTGLHFDLIANYHVGEIILDNCKGIGFYSNEADVDLIKVTNMTFDKSTPPFDSSNVKCFMIDDCVVKQETGIGSSVLTVATGSVGFINNLYYSESSEEGNAYINIQGEAYINNLNSYNRNTNVFSLGANSSLSISNSMFRANFKAGTNKVNVVNSFLGGDKIQDWRTLDGKKYFSGFNGTTVSWMLLG